MSPLISVNITRLLFNPMNKPSKTQADSISLQNLTVIWIPSRISMMEIFAHITLDHSELKQVTKNFYRLFRLTLQ